MKGGLRTQDPEGIKPNVAARKNQVFADGLYSGGIGGGGGGGKDHNLKRWMRIYQQPFC